MARLDRQDRSGRCQVVFVRYLARGSQIGADPDTFEDAGGGEEFLHGAEGEGVGAFCRGGGAECGGQEVYVRFLVGGDFG